MNNSTGSTGMNASPNCRESSPVKQRTPSRRSSNMSPRKSPFSVRKSFECEAVSFTPKRTQQPPRAWERRPATPFVPRDDKQKIWKRVPLGELGVDGNRPSGLSKRAQESGKDYVRVVKKLKVGHEEKTDSADEDKENMVLAVGSKIVRDDDDCDHMKKKKVSFSNDLVDAGVEAEPEALFAESRTVADESNNGNEDSDSQIEHEEGEDLVVVDSDNIKAGNIDSDASNQASHETIAEAMHQVSESIEPVDKLEVEAQTTHEENDLIEPGIATTETPKVQDEAALQQTELARESDEDVDAGDDRTARDERSSSPPTILVDNITVDELAAKESAEVDFQGQAAASSEQNSSIGQDGSRRTSDGEAAFLRAFMDRAINEKTAREKALEMSSDSANVEIEQEPSEHLEAQSEIVEQEVEEQVKSTSPLRRSKRAVVTNIPRPQSIPNAIQLKRASGNEFIFTANKGTSTMNVVAATRANTKKNKGLSLNVPSRLEQLTAQKAGETVENAESAKSETSNRNSKKRKQDKISETSTVKKVLRWNDENLVAFREADPQDDIDDIEDSSQEHAQGGRNDEETTKAVKLRLTVNSAQKAEKENTRQTGLRRVRRGVAGTVNGTPAPKARARKLDEMSAVEDKAENDVAGIADSETTKFLSTATTSKIPSSSRRSRMPVPTLNKKDSASAEGKSATASAKVHGKAEQQLGRRSLRTRQ